MRPKKKCGFENRKTQILLQATVTTFVLQKLESEFCHESLRAESTTMKLILTFGPGIDLLSYACGCRPRLHGYGSGLW
jgi:hypothetical protein